MDYETNEKVNAITSEVHEEEYDDYDEEGMDFEETTEESNSPKKSNKSMKKQLIILMLIIGGGMLILLLLLSLVSKLSVRNYDYEDVEEIMKKAAINYFEEKKSSLPQDETQVVEIEAGTLAASEYMKPLEEYLGEASGCTGKVQVRKSGEEYVYTPYLMCGEKYSTKFLAEEITSEDKLAGYGYGLYYMNDTYVFRGEEVNNYIELDAKTWRIVKVNSDKTVTITLEQPISTLVKYDDRYNQVTNRDTGINSFQTSRVREGLQDLYNTNEDDSRIRYILSANDKTKLVKYDICVNKMSVNDTMHNNSLECAQTVSGYIGLLTVSDYMNASIDTGCTKVNSQSCKNYNYLNSGETYWLVTPSNRDTSSAFKVVGGVIQETMTNEGDYMKPVVTISSSALISGGDGTKENPYKLK